MAAPALGAVRLHPEVMHKYMEGARAMRELGATTSSGGTRAGAAAGAAAASSFGGSAARGVTSQSRGKIYRVPLFRTSSTPRREALLSAMSEEHDITDMQETDKVSGEWWKPILTAVHDWSQDKLLGLAELADGSLFFSFGPGSDSNSASPAKASKPKSESTKITSSASPNNSTPQKTVLPQRHPSSFRKHSPIPASRKKAVDLNEAAVESKPQKTQKAAKSKPSSKSAAQPQRPPSSFIKRSPIPKNRVNSVFGSVSAPASKNKSHSAVEETAVVDAPSFDSAIDSELKEILNSGNKETTEQKSKESVKSAKKSSATPAPAKKAPSKPLTEETVKAASQTSSASESPAVKKKASSKPLTEETVEAASQTSSASESPAVKKKASSKSLTEETVEAAPQTASEPLVATKKKVPKVTSEEETVEAAPQTASEPLVATKKKVPKVTSEEETVEAAPQTASEPLVATKKKVPKVTSEEETVVEVTDAAENNGAAAMSGDLGNYKLPELRSLAKARGLKGYSKLKKGDLVDLLAGLES